MRHSILVVYTGPTSTPDYYQPYSHHRTRPQTLTKDYGRRRCFCYSDQHQRVLHLDTCSLADKQEVSHNQRILGPDREEPLSNRRCFVELVFPQNCQSESNRERPHQIQQARAIQSAHSLGLTPHGRNDHRRYVNTQLIRVSPSCVTVGGRRAHPLQIHTISPSSLLSQTQH
jgi:hypothetical protein